MSRTQPNLAYSGVTSPWTLSRLGGLNPAIVAVRHVTGSTWVVLDINHKLWRSTDNGATWAGPVTLPSVGTPDTGSIKSIGSTIVIGTNDTDVNTSTDAGATWAAHVISTSISSNAIECSNSIFIAVGPDTITGNARFFSSTDGITWTARLVSTDFQVGARPRFGGSGIFVAVGAGSVAPFPSSATSPDGITWTEHSTLPIDTLNGSFQYIQALEDGVNFYAFLLDNTGTQKMGFSTDGFTWGLQSPLPTLPFASVGIEFLGGNYVLPIADNNQVVVATVLNPWNGVLTSVPSSPNGATIIVIDETGPTSNLRFFIQGAVGAGVPFVFTSTNSSAWSQEDAHFIAGEGIIDGTFGNGIFMVVGNNGKVSTRPA